MYTIEQIKVFSVINLERGIGLMPHIFKDTDTGFAKYQGHK